MVSPEAPGVDPRAPMWVLRRGIQDIATQAGTT